MRLRHIILLTAVLPLAAGCALGPRVPAPDTHVPIAYEAPTDVTQPGVPLDQWWKTYNDPQLDSLVDQALATAPDARTAIARLDEAFAQRAGALDQYNPQGALQGQVINEHTQTVGAAPTFLGIPLTNTGASTTAQLNFNVSWEIDLFGRREAARRKANADLATAQFEYEASRTALIANVADGLFVARGLAIQLEDAKEDARIERELARVARAKADHGLGSAADADQAEAIVAQSDSQVADLSGQLHAARRVLLVLIGKGVDPLDTLPAAASAEPPPPVPTSVPGELLARRPDVRQAAAELRSAAGQLKLDELDLFPKFNLLPGIGINSTPEFGTSLVSYAWSIGAGVAQPILDIHRLKTVISAQGYRTDAAAVAYEHAVQSAYSDAENSLVQLSADEERVRVLTTGEAQAKRAYDAARIRYTAGIDDLTATLSAERTWRATRTLLTSAEVQALRRSVQAFKALGGGWDPTHLPVEQAFR